MLLMNKLQIDGNFWRDNSIRFFRVSFDSLG